MNRDNKCSKEKRCNGKIVYCSFKRVIDVVVSSVGLIFLSPIFLITSVFIKLESEGPIIYKQKRVGKNGKVFVMYKFRSMRVDTPIKSSLEFKDSDDYTTKVGSFLRKTSLDESPQLFNVLKGDMSLIGPRPVIEKEVDLIKSREDSGVSSILPGLTGWAQINGRDKISNKEKARLDKEYLDKRSVRFDIYITFKTIHHLMNPKERSKEVKPTNKNTI